MRAAPAPLSWAGQVASLPSFVAAKAAERSAAPGKRLPPLRPLSAEIETAVTAVMDALSDGQRWGFAEIVQVVALPPKHISRAIQHLRDHKIVTISGDKPKHYVYRRVDIL